MDTYASPASANAAACPVSPAAARAVAPAAGSGVSLEAVAVDFDPELWRLDGPARAALAGIWPRLAPEVDTILDEFYVFMGRFPENGPHFADRGKVDCLKLLQKEHLQVFFKAVFDSDFLNRVHTIGAAHARVSLPPRYLIAGYAFLIERMVRSVLQHNRRHPVEAAAQIGALIRGLMLEVYVTSEVYTQTTHNEQMLNAMQGLAESFEQELDQAVEFVRRSAGSMEVAADIVLEATGRVSADSAGATDASNQANSNAQTIAAAAEELSPRSPRFPGRSSIRPWRPTRRRRSPRAPRAMPRNWPRSPSASARSSS
ncbi:MAG: globin-coupled sensor protein [Rhodospirillaceae bacterium]